MLMKTHELLGSQLIKTKTKPNYKELPEHHSFQWIHKYSPLLNFFKIFTISVLFNLHNMFVWSCEILSFVSQRLIKPKSRNVLFVYSTTWVNTWKSHLWLQLELLGCVSISVANLDANSSWQNCTSSARLHETTGEQQCSSFATDSTWDWGLGFV